MTIRRLLTAPLLALPAFLCCGCFVQTEPARHEVSPAEQAWTEGMQKRIADLLLLEPSEQQPPTGDPICDMINEERAEWGCAPLAVSSGLMKAADIRMDEVTYADMNALHSRPAGTDWSTVLPEVHSSAVICGETVLMGGADAETAVNAMLLSLSQTDYLICDKYKQIGYAHNDTYDLWVLIFTE